MIKLNDIIPAQILDDSQWGKKYFSFTATKKLQNFLADILFDEIYNASLKKNPTSINVINQDGSYDPGKKLDDANTKLSWKNLETGKTLRIRQLDQYNDKIKLLQQLLENYFKYSVGINYYASATGTQGVGLHYDVHHVFAYQLSGSKTWKLWPVVTTKPRPGYIPDIETTVMNTSPSIVVLNPGDMIYIPQGMPHLTTSNSNSEHITLGVSIPDYYDYFSLLLKNNYSKFEFLRTELNFKVSNDDLYYLHPDSERCIEKITQLLKHMISEAQDELENNVPMK